MVWYGMVWYSIHKGILHSGSKANRSAISKTMVCKILMFMWSLGDLNSGRSGFCWIIKGCGSGKYSQRSQRGQNDPLKLDLC